MNRKRIRDRKYLRWVALHRCLVCGATEKVVPHHLMKVPDEPSAMGLKSGDNWAVPLCHDHHTGGKGVHHHGNEPEFFASHGIDALSEAENLWTIYNGLFGTKP